MLRKFFRNKGTIAELPRNYANYVSSMADLIGGRVGEPLLTPEECMIHHKTYEYRIIVAGGVVCTIPSMTDQGYFIIQGSEKVIVIQENRLASEPFTTANPACCELFAQGASVPIRVKMVDNSVIELDTSMIHRNMRGVKFIGMFEVFTHIFAFDIEHISLIMRSYCEEQWNACMTYIVSSIRGTGGLYADEDREVIRSKMFGSIDDDQIVATLITMISSCVSVHLKRSKPSDRDDYIFKCLRTPGETVYRMFKYCLASSKNQKNLKGAVEKYIHGFIKRGDIVIGERTYNRMAIQLSRRSDIDVLSCIRKVMMPCDENSQNLIMRQIHNSQKGYICPCETPEGKTVGITKSLACTCLISEKADISEWIESFCRDSIFPGCTWVIVDGVATGWCNIEDTLLLKKAYPTVSVTISTSNVVKIRTAAGRPIRPLLKVENHPVDWKNPEIVYLDPAESAVAKIASVGYDGNWSNFTHMEIHPCTMLGLAASLIPFPEHNQSARNVFSSSMIKQAMQMNRNLDKSCDTLQRPLVQTAIGREIGYDDNPNGLNLVVCIMSLGGFNQEDAIIVKKSSVDRGMFSSVVRSKPSVAVENPWKVVDKSNKVSILHGGTEKQLADVTSMLSSPKIADVKEMYDSSGRSKISVTMEVHRTLELGDKMSSRHGQKGVVGVLMNDEDMPYSPKDGMSPDIIINPHAIPSRMTVGQLIEGVMGKSAAMSGTFVDGTPFVRRSVGEMTKLGETETLIMGTTGEMVQTPITMGIVYYMALKHQAADKIYVRSSGPKSIISRQPISGRSKGGGLRFGEMEYDCLVAHGASKLITEVSRDSDMVEAPYCDRCKIVTDVFDGNCRLCGCPTVRKHVPFSYVVLKDMMLSANIQVQTEL